ncbi:SUMF1/EgtB/PvdO family nonheme iron enzyme [Methylolobus aquaticus]
MNARPAISPGKSGLGRADLLRALASGGPDVLEAAASLLGYEREPAKPPQDDRDDEGRNAGPATGDRETLPPQPVVENWPRRPPAKFFYLARREAKPDAEIEQAREGPVWLKTARRLTEDERPAPEMMQPPAPLPLTRWSRLWPFLRRSLGQTATTRQLDVPRLVRAVTRGQVLSRVPMHERQRWCLRISIVVDYSPRTIPFWDDFNRLLSGLEKLHGAAGLDVHWLDGPPGRELRVRRDDLPGPCRWTVPEPSTPLLILSDLGQIGNDAEVRRGWQRLGIRLRAAGCRPIVLCPIPEPGQDPVLRRLFAVYEWDAASRFLRPARAPRRETPVSRVESTERLLVLASPCIRVEPALLRALRGLLPAHEAAAIDEAEVWRHEDVVSSTQGFGFSNPRAVERWQTAFRALNSRLQQRVVDLLLRHHQHLPASIRYPELLTCERLAPGSVPEKILQAAQRWARDILKTCAADAVPAGLRDWLRRHVERQPDSAWARNDVLAALWALSKREAVRAGATLAYPPGVTGEQVEYFLGGDSDATRRVVLVQQGPGLVLCDSDVSGPGSPYGHFSLRGDAVSVKVWYEAGASQASRVPVPQLPLVVNETLAEAVSIEIDTGIEKLLIRHQVWPSVGEMGRQQSGLYVEVPWLTKPQRLVWEPPRGSTWDDISRSNEGETLAHDPSGRWVGDGPVGWDEIGLYADLTVQGVTQRFRWIAPGTFRMGSPAGEPKRLVWEMLHEVTLTRGCWLADTACTQALWQAVMGGNPSSFRDDPENPVENVFWEDVQGFIARLNEQAAGLNARLPTEAEWEYACRAGTETPFSFGDTVTPEQVNYDGNRPYAGAPMGLSRGKTVPVKALAANRWGLYQMHGNVWEWCADWFGDYQEDSVADPTGPAEGATRVLRGGSWVGSARNARSAFRRGPAPAARLGSLGFRFALGPASPEQAAERQPGRAPGQAAASERRGGAGKRAPGRKTSTSKKR